jgi:hypothetical protein
MREISGKWPCPLPHSEDGLREFGFNCSMTTCCLDFDQDRHRRFFRDIVLQLQEPMFVFSIKVSHLHIVGFTNNSDTVCPYNDLLTQEFRVIFRTIFHCDSSSLKDSSLWCFNTNTYCVTPQDICVNIWKSMYNNFRDILSVKLLKLLSIFRYNSSPVYVIENLLLTTFFNKFYRSEGPICAIFRRSRRPHLLFPKNYLFVFISKTGHSTFFLLRKKNKEKLKKH